MSHVNIYIKTNITGRAITGCVTWLIEMQTQKGPATLNDTFKLTGTTGHQAEIAGLVVALTRLTAPCELSVFTGDGWLARVVNEWLKQWSDNDWCKSDGQPVSNIAELITLQQALKRHTVTASAEHTEYTKWLTEENRRFTENERQSETKN